MYIMYAYYTIKKTNTTLSNQKRLKTQNPEESFVVDKKKKKVEARESEKLREREGVQEGGKDFLASDWSIPKPSRR